MNVFFFVRILITIWTNILQIRYFRNSIVSFELFLIFVSSIFCFQLQLEWAWKPMAAMMNENQTDLVYWIPPLYSSNIVTTTSVHTRRPSITARPHALASSTQRKKKLSRRRAKLLSSDDSYEDVKDTDTLVDVNELKDDDTESGIHDDTFDTSTDDTSTLNIQSIEEEDKLMEDNDDSTLETSSMVTTIAEESSKASREQSEAKRQSKTPSKGSSRPTILRLLDKMSHLHGIPGNPLASKAKKPAKTPKEPRAFENKKARRPSVKVYHNPPKARLSNRRSKATQMDGGEEPCIIVSLDPNAAPTKVPAAAAEILVESQPSVKEQADPAAVRHAQLQMILRLLAQLYEEKVSRQDTEIQNLKTKLQTQDKLMRQMAHLVLGLKEEVTKLKGHCGVDARPHKDKQYNVLSIKVGDTETISC